MLPGVDELHVRSARGHHVAELAVEIVPRPAVVPAPAAVPASEAHGRHGTRV
jgi:hypothetical protein